MQRNDPLDTVEWAYSHAAHDYARDFLWLPPNGLVDAYKRPTDAEIHHMQNISEQLDNGYRWLGFNMHWTPELRAQSGDADDALYNCVTSPAVHARCFVNGTAQERARCALNGLVDLGQDTGCYPLFGAPHRAASLPPCLPAFSHYSFVNSPYVSGLRSLKNCQTCRTSSNSSRLRSATTRSSSLLEPSAMIFPRGVQK